MQPGDGIMLLGIHPGHDRRGRGNVVVPFGVSLAIRMRSTDWLQHGLSLDKGG